MTNKTIILLLLVFTVQGVMAENLSEEEILGSILVCGERGPKFGTNWDTLVLAEGSAEKAWIAFDKNATDGDLEFIAICMYAVPHYFTRHDDLPPQYFLYLPDKLKIE